MSSVRVDNATVKISEERKHYLSGNTLFVEGKKQGEVKAMREFDVDIYNQNQFKKHQEQTIPLPTELLKRDNVDYHKIAQELISALGVENKYGIGHVSYFVHYRDENSGRTKNDNLHIHIGYVDRTIISNNAKKLYPDNKRPYAINLISHKNVRLRDYRADSIAQFKVEEDTAKLDMNLVSVELVEKFKELTSNGRTKKYSDDQRKEIEDVKAEIVMQAQSKSNGVIVYSNRIESENRATKALKENTQTQRDNVRDVLNNVLKEYDLQETIEEYGWYDSETKASKAEKKKAENKAECERITARAVKEKAVIAENKKRKAENDAEKAELNIEKAQLKQDVETNQRNLLKITTQYSNLRKRQILQNKQDVVKAFKCKELIDKLYRVGVIVPPKADKMLQDLGFYWETEEDGVGYNNPILEIRPDFGEYYPKIINEITKSIFKVQKREQTKLLEEIESLVNSEDEYYSNVGM